jgi:hypothetical protein
MAAPADILYGFPRPAPIAIKIMCGGIPPTLAAN